LLDDHVGQVGELPAEGGLIADGGLAAADFEGDGIAVVPCDRPPGCGKAAFDLDDHVAGAARCAEGQEAGVGAVRLAVGRLVPGGGCGSRGEHGVRPHGPWILPAGAVVDEIGVVGAERGIGGDGAHGVQDQADVSRGLKIHGDGLARAQKAGGRDADVAHLGQAQGLGRGQPEGQGRAEAGRLQGQG